MFVVCPNLIGDDNHICLFGGCLLITYVPESPSFNVKTPLYICIIIIYDSKKQPQDVMNKKRRGWLQKKTKMNTTIYKYIIHNIKSFNIYFIA